MKHKDEQKRVSRSSEILSQYRRVDQERREQWVKAIEKFKKEIRDQAEDMIKEMRIRSAKVAELAKKHTIG